MKKKRILVPWSGGVDSTFMIHMLLEQGHTVDAIYIDLLNNAVKSKREQAAIRKIQKTSYFKGLPGKFSYLGVGARFETLRFGRAPQLSQPLIFLTGLVYTMREHHDELALGFIMNDDAISYLDEIRAAYRGMTALCEKRKHPKLVFPLKQTNKDDAFKALPAKVRIAVTWCESPGKTDRCMECTPCKRMLREVGPEVFPTPNVIDLADMVKERAVA